MTIDRPSINRREAFGVLFGTGALLALTSCSSDAVTDTATLDEPTDTSSTPGSTPVSAQPVGSSPELEETVRDLTLKLWAEPTTATIVSGLESDVYSFGAEVVDGDPASVVAGSSYLGPTLHMRTGQQVRVTFENRLPDESIVHWHGLVVPQDQDGQPADAVAAGGTYEYDFVVPNDPGTFWYHPHPHGKTGEQVYRGLAGLLIVHGDEPALPSGANDIGVVLQDRTIDPDGQLRYVTGRHDQMAGFVGNTLVTNGVADFVVEVRREPYRIRLLNGANSRTQYLTWSTGDVLTAIATDGSLLPEAVDIAGLVITPAQRTDLWVDFSAFEPGQRIELLSADTFVEAGGMMGQGGGGGQGQGGGEGQGGGDEHGGDLNLDAQVAAVFVVVESDPTPGSVPSPLGTSPSFGAADAVNASNPKEFVLSTRRAAHWINDLQWAGREVTEVETVNANDVELWEFVSRSPLPHPMHLHGNAFRVISRSWDDDSAADSWAAIEHGVIETGLRDTVLVWPGQRVQIAVPFPEHLGYFLYHCHILEHEDDGMMRNFLVK